MGKSVKAVAGTSAAAGDRGETSACKGGKSKLKKRRRKKDLEELHRNVLETRKNLRKRSIPRKSRSRASMGNVLNAFAGQRQENHNRTQGIDVVTGLKRGPKKICERLLPRSPGMYTKGAVGKAVRKNNLPLNGANRARLHGDIFKLLNGHETASKNGAVQDVSEDGLRKAQADQAPVHEPELPLDNVSGSPILAKKREKQRKLFDERDREECLSGSRHLKVADEPGVGPDAELKGRVDTERKCKRRLFQSTKEHVASADRQHFNRIPISDSSLSDKERVGEASSSRNDDRCMEDTSRSGTSKCNGFIWSPVTRYEELCTIICSDNYSTRDPQRDHAADALTKIREKLRCLYVDRIRTQLQRENDKGSTEKVELEHLRQESALSSSDFAEVQACTGNGSTSGFNANLEEIVESQANELTRNEEKRLDGKDKKTACERSSSEKNNCRSSNIFTPLPSGPCAQNVSSFTEDICRDVLKQFTRKAIMAPPRAPEGYATLHRKDCDSFSVQDGANVDCTITDQLELARRSSVANAQSQGASQSVSESHVKFTVPLEKRLLNVDDRVTNNRVRCNISLSAFQSQLNSNIKKLGEQDVRQGGTKNTKYVPTILRRSGSSNVPEKIDRLEVIDKANVSDNERRKSNRASANENVSHKKYSSCSAHCENCHNCNVASQAPGHTDVARSEFVRSRCRKESQVPSPDENECTMRVNDTSVPFSIRSSTFVQFHTSNANPRCAHFKNDPYRAHRRNDDAGANESRCKTDTCGHVQRDRPNAKGDAACRGCDCARGRQDLGARESRQRDDFAQQRPDAPAIVVADDRTRQTRQQLFADSDGVTQMRRDCARVAQQQNHSFDTNATLLESNERQLRRGQNKLTKSVTFREDTRVCAQSQERHGSLSSAVASGNCAGRSRVSQAARLFSQRASPDVGAPNDSADLEVLTLHGSQRYHPGSSNAADHRSGVGTVVLHNLQPDKYVAYEDGQLQRRVPVYLHRRGEDAARNPPVRLVGANGESLPDRYARIMVLSEGDRLARRQDEQRCFAMPRVQRASQAADVVYANCLPVSNVTFCQEKIPADVLVPVQEPPWLSSSAGRTNIPDARYSREVCYVPVARANNASRSDARDTSMGGACNVTRETANRRFIIERKLQARPDTDTNAGFDVSNEWPKTVKVVNKKLGVLIPKTYVAQNIDWNGLNTSDYNSRVVGSTSKVQVLADPIRPQTERSLSQIYNVADVYPVEMEFD